LTPNELVLTFGGLHLCVKFGKNPQRNAIVRVTTHGQTDRHTDTDRQTQTDFIICPMLYAVAMGQIKMIISPFVPRTSGELSGNVCSCALRL